MRLFAVGREANAELFARRILRFPEVQSLDIDPLRATATVRYRVPPGGPGPLLRRFAAALRDGEALEPNRLPPFRWGEAIRLRRYGRIVTTLEILSLGERRLDVRHVAIGREPETARRVEDALRRSSGRIAAERRRRQGADRARPRGDLRGLSDTTDRGGTRSAYSLSDAPGPRGCGSRWPTSRWAWRFWASSPCRASFPWPRACSSSATSTPSARRRPVARAQGRPARPLHEHPRDDPA